MLMWRKLSQSRFAQLTPSLAGGRDELPCSSLPGRQVVAGKRGDHRRMVRRPWPLTRRAVDPRPRTASPQRGRDQDVVDAQAVVAGEGQRAVVPPAVQSTLLVVQAYSVN